MLTNPMFLDVTCFKINPITKTLKKRASWNPEDKQKSYAFKVSESAKKAHASSRIIELGGILKNFMP